MSLSGKRYALTGGSGFLGWHTRLAIHSYGASSMNIPVGKSFDRLSCTNAMESADVLIHLAGVNRDSDEAIAAGNRLFATQIANGLRSCENPPSEVVYSNSIQALSGGVYGEAKEAAGEILAEACESMGIRFRTLMLPNVFGEHGRPFYNSVVSTFCHLLSTGEGEPAVQEDRDLTLIHAQDVADWLVGTIDDAEATLRFQYSSVSGLLELIAEFSDIYSTGDIPDVSTKLRRDLFNTFRSYIADQGPEGIPIVLTRHRDPRGSFFEVIRTRGGTGQSSFSTTAPGISRGDHYHRRKIERFAILSGSATIQLRKMFTDKVLEFQIEGEEPVAIDMPTGWSHNVTNTGETTLYMHFWSDDLFDPSNPDTVPERV